MFPQRSIQKLLFLWEANYNFLYYILKEVNTQGCMENYRKRGINIRSDLLFGNFRSPPPPPIPPEK